MFVSEFFINQWVWFDSSRKANWMFVSDFFLICGIIIMEKQAACLFLNFLCFDVFALSNSVEVLFGWWNIKKKLLWWHDSREQSCALSSMFCNI